MLTSSGRGLVSANRLAFHYCCGYRVLHCGMDRNMERRELCLVPTVHCPQTPCGCRTCIEIEMEGTKSEKMKGKEMK